MPPLIQATTFTRHHTLSDAEDACSCAAASRVVQLYMMYKSVSFSHVLPILLPSNAEEAHRRMLVSRALQLHAVQQWSLSFTCFSYLVPSHTEEAGRRAAASRAL